MLGFWENFMSQPFPKLPTTSPNPRNKSSLPSLYWDTSRFSRVGILAHLEQKPSCPAAAAFLEVFGWRAWTAGGCNNGLPGVLLGWASGRSHQKIQGRRRMRRLSPILCPPAPASSLCTFRCSHGLPRGCRLWSSALDPVGFPKVRPHLCRYRLH